MMPEMIAEPLREQGPNALSISSAARVPPGLSSTLKQVTSAIVLHTQCLLMHWTASPEKLVVKNQDVAREALDILRQHFVLECPVSVQGCQTHKFAAQNLQKPQPHVQISHKYLFTDGMMGWR